MYDFNCAISVFLCQNNIKFRHNAKTECDINSDTVIQMLSNSHFKLISRSRRRWRKRSEDIVQLHSYLILIACNQISSEANHHNHCWAGFFIAHRSFDRTHTKCEQVSERVSKKVCIVISM